MIDGGSLSGALDRFVGARQKIPHLVGNLYSSFGILRLTGEVCFLLVKYRIYNAMVFQVSSLKSQIQVPCSMFQVQVPCSIYALPYRRDVPLTDVMMTYQGTYYLSIPSPATGLISASST